MMKKCCPRCKREVYFAERKVALGKVWHNFCFSCYKCRKLLDACSVNTCNGELYCTACFNVLLDPCEPTPVFDKCCDPDPCRFVRDRDISEKCCCSRPRSSSPKRACCTCKNPSDPCDPCCRPLSCNPCPDPCCACCCKKPRKQSCPLTEHYSLRPTPARRKPCPSTNACLNECEPPTDIWRCKDCGGW